MKNTYLILASAFLCAGLVPVYSQPGRMPAIPQMSGHMAKLFGGISAYSATMETQSKDSSGNSMTMSSKIFSLDGKTRVETDMAKMQSGNMSPDAAEQMKTMGMDRMVMISRPDKKISYLIYPGLQACAENPMQDRETTAAADYKVETTELGRETVDGHPCVKTKVIVTDDQGTKHESVVWNATDLKKFPVKIETVQQGKMMTISFKDVNLAKPDAGLFEPPSGYKQYDSMQAMMQQEMMKRLGGGMGMPPH
jgi:outer membrane lipoprotein-sorting protein